MRTIHVTLVASERATTELKGKDVSLEEITEALTTVKVGPKDGNAIIPARFRPCPTPCRNHGKPGSFDCGGGKLHRLSANVQAMTGLVLDFDGLVEDERDYVLKKIRERKLGFTYWETHSHAPPNDCRFRIAMWFETEMKLPSADAWKKVAFPSLVQWLGIEKYVDKACSDPARIYFTPRKPHKDEERGSFNSWPT